MSLFGDLVGSLLGGNAQQQQQPGQSGNVGATLVSMLSQPGALQGLMDKFNQAGLGNVVQSWVSNGSNQPVSPDAVHNALGTDNVQQLAQHTGLSVPDLLQQLAAHLPHAVDGMTPGGQVPPPQSLTDIGLSLLRSRFGGAPPSATA